MDVNALIEQYGLLTVVISFVAYVLVQQYRNDRQTDNESERLSARAESATISGHTRSTETIAQLALQMNAQAISQQGAMNNLIEQQAELRIEIQTLKSQRDKLQDEITILKATNDDLKSQIAAVREENNNLRTRLFKIENPTDEAEKTDTDEAA